MAGHGGTLKLIRRCCCVVALALQACVAAPTLPPPAATGAASAAASTAALPAVADKLAITGVRGRLNRSQREALLRRLGSEGSATLMQRHLAAMTAVDSVDLSANNQTRLLVDGPATFDAMFKAIDEARSSVLVESYIVEDVAVAKRLGDALLRKRSQGLQVALLYDAVGSRGTDKSYFDALSAGGVAVCAFNPLKPTERRTDQSLTHRDHRKIVVVDRQVAFTGGINISAVYSSGSFSSRRGDPPPGDDNGWRDTHLQVRGPAAAIFDDLVRATWREQNCSAALAAPRAGPPRAGAGNDVLRIVATRPDAEYSRIYALMMTAIDVAQRSIYLTMAYFAPGAEMVDALCEAAARGVDVQLVLPSRSDFTPVLYAGRSHYSKMLACGIQVHELQNSVLHAKTAVIDGVLSTVGSSNLDYRSFASNNEIDAVVLGEDFGTEMTKLFRRDVAESKTITLQAWQSRPLAQRLKEALSRAFESWW